MKFESLAQQLSCSIAFFDHDRKRYSNYINDAIEKGIDINSFLECGQTPLTSAIEGGTGSPKAVELLLNLGADVNQRDNQGWTPWAHCYQRSSDRVVKKRMKKISDILERYPIDKSDERVLNFQTAILDKNIGFVTKYIDEGGDITSKMISPLSCAIKIENVQLIKLLISNGITISPPEDGEESPLMQAAARGNRSIVELLVESGADVNYYAYEDKKHTAALEAKYNGHIDIEKYLLGLMDNAVCAPKIKKKYWKLVENKFDACNYQLSLENCIKKLEVWHKKYSITLSNESHNGFTVAFKKLPKDTSKLANEIYDFCPDIIDQGYGCMDDLYKLDLDAKKEVSPSLLELIEGIDFADSMFGLALLQKDLKKKKELSLWWD